ncbi:hypothetical protein D9M70_553610 [compost metagenome]
MFSTTAAWNCRGRQMIAIIATPICTTIDGQFTVSDQNSFSSGAALACSSRLSKPPYRP